jgi:tetratricopeptide (TPR) repeat protein
MREHGLIVCCLVAIALTSSLPAQTTHAQSTALNDGVQLMREGRFDQAVVKLEEAHRAAPRNATIENLLGISETQLGHIDAACAHYRSAISLDPSQPSPHKNLGFNLLNKRDYAGAEPELREASRLDPNDNFAHFYLLLLALATGHDAEATDQASHVGSLLDNDAGAGIALIGAEVRLGRADEASKRIEHMETANQLSTTQEYSIAVLLSQHALYGEAVHCFRRIASLEATWESHYNLALALLYDGQFADASTTLTVLHNERPASADTLMFLGSALEMQQKMPEALEAYRAAVVADPSNPDRMLDYTRLLMDTDRYDEAIEAVQTGMGQTSTTAPLQLRLGAVEMLKSNYPAARAAFESALASDPQLDAAYVGLAQTYARQANDAEAIRILEAARKTRPDHYALEYYFGMLASRLGREPEAITALQKAAALEPKSLDPSYELAKIYLARQDWARARQYLEYVVELSPQFQPAHYQLSHVYAHLGLDEKAAQEVEQTRILVNKQREEALRKQRERAASFQPASPSPLTSHP